MDTVNPIRLRRIAKGMTQSELASAAGISQQLMSKLESGKINLKPEKAVEFAEILGCRPAELIPALALSPQPETKNLQELRLLTLYRELKPDQQIVISNMAELMANQNDNRATAN